MDTVYSDVAAINDGSICAQLYVGTKSTVTDVYGMKTEKQLVNTLKDNIRERGAMKQLLSDSAQSEISKRVFWTFCTHCVSLVGRANLTNSTKTCANAAFKTSNE
jgi:hypothetical protein